MDKPAGYTTKIRERNWLSESTYELICDRPHGFAFKPGQKIRFKTSEAPREYSIASAPEENTLKLCIRKIDGGRVSTELSNLVIGSELLLNGPYGYFNYQPSDRQAVFIATGTGIAPFVAMSRAGVKNFILLHGVRRSDELYYRSELETAAFRYIPCISNAYNSNESESHPGHYPGRVTDFIESELAPATYDFYLCGSGAMIKDVILIVDDRFEGSHIFTEKFY